MTTTTDKRAIGAEWKGAPDTDSYMQFVKRADPERAAREKRDEKVADLHKRAIYGWEEWTKAEDVGNEKRAEKFMLAYYYRIEQLDALERIPLLFWCQSCGDTPTAGQDEAQGALDGMDDRLPHAMCLSHMDDLLRERAERRARGE